ncbi:UNVERIFIED_CONTAM: hypothetical protein GTU68_037275 [Idotea baltica]|nr:hypothetical protein [Idotea baltica]
MYTMFFVSSTVYYGIALNAVNFKLDPFMYMVVNGLMEVPAYSLSAPVVARFGRVPPTVISFFICGGTILALAFIPNEIKWLVIIAAMAGKFFISSAYQILYLVSTEVFPTEIRLQGIGTSSFVSRIGSLIAPYVTDYLGPLLPWVPSVVFGLLSLLAGVAGIFVPETLSRHLPETIKELEEEALIRKRRKSQKAVEENDS